jgi:hypothetical protein
MGWTKSNIPNHYLKYFFAGLSLSGTPILSIRLQPLLQTLLTTCFSSVADPDDYLPDPDMFQSKF